MRDLLVEQFAQTSKPFFGVIPNGAVFQAERGISGLTALSRKPNSPLPAPLNSGCP
jgi:hypothetical protein